MKVCIKCNIEKAEDDFFFYKSRNWRDSFCKECRNADNRNWYKRGKGSEFYRRKELLIIGRNICRTCKQEKSIEAFYRSEHVNTGYRNICIECMKLVDKNNKLKSTYGITLEDYHTMLEKQKGYCAICKGRMSGLKNICIDHCHQRGVIRGLLCNKCNRAIGLLKEDTQVLYSAIRYLKSSVLYKSGELSEKPEVVNTEPSQA